MNSRSEQEDQMIRYLLGQMGEEEQTRIEERFFADDQFFEQLMAVEDALADEYALDKLSSVEREQFQQANGSYPSTLREIGFIRGLIHSLSGMQAGKAGEATAARFDAASRSRALPGLTKRTALSRRHLLVAALVIIAFGISVFICSLILNKRDERIAAERAVMIEKERLLQEQISNQLATNEGLVKQLEAERRRRRTLLDDLPPSPAAKKQVEVASVLLTAGGNLRSGGDVSTVRMRPGARLLKIQIQLEKDDRYKHYGAVIKTFDGRKVWAKDSLETRPSSLDTITLTLRARSLANDDYILTLQVEGEDGRKVDLHDYHFRVRRR